MKYEALRKAAYAIAERTGRGGHRAAVVLGSGLSGYADDLPKAVRVPYSEIPGFPAPKVEGHHGALYSAEFDGRPVLVLAGRVHYYEGWTMDEVVFAVRTAALAGCRAVLLTNAAGGIGDGLGPGDLVIIRDHINLTAANPLMGPNDDRLGPRFPDQTNVYRPELRHLLHEVSAGTGTSLGEGVYAWLTGPTYETPAEIRMLGRMGADLVGMSTVPEAIALNHMGVAVAGISLVTNLAAGVSPTPLSHAEVTETAAAARERFTTLLDAFLPRLASFETG
jgi:purine-nucleoside phosphorylase